MLNDFFLIPVLAIEEADALDLATSLIQGEALRTADIGSSARRIAELGVAGLSSSTVSSSNLRWPRATLPSLRSRQRLTRCSSMPMTRSRCAFPRSSRLVLPGSGGHGGCDPRHARPLGGAGCSTHPDAECPFGGPRRQPSTSHGIDGRDAARSLPGSRYERRLSDLAETLRPLVATGSGALIVTRPHLSRFSPSKLPAETLDRLFVQRHRLLDEILHCLRESARSDSRHHVLMVGPRGSARPT